MMGEVSKAKQLRDAAKLESDELTKFNMIQAAGIIEKAVVRFAIDPTDDNLKLVNSQWSRAARLMGFAKPKEEE